MASRSFGSEAPRSPSADAAAASVVPYAAPVAILGPQDMNHSEIVSFLWGVADLIRDSFKRGKYQDVILPLTVLRRLDCVLAPTKEDVLRGRLREIQADIRKIEADILCVLRDVAGSSLSAEHVAP